MSHPRPSRNHTDDSQPPESTEQDTGAPVQLAGKAPARDTQISRKRPTSPPEDPERGKGLTKISANFVPRGVVALQQATEITGDNATDVLNRSVQLYAHITRAIKEGKLVFVEDPKTGERERLLLL